MHRYKKKTQDMRFNVANFVCKAYSRETALQHDNPDNINNTLTSILCMLWAKPISMSLPTALPLFWLCQLGF